MYCCSENKHIVKCWSVGLWLELWNWFCLVSWMVIASHLYVLVTRSWDFLGNRMLWNSQICIWHTLIFPTAPSFVPLISRESRRNVRSRYDRYIFLSILLDCLPHCCTVYRVEYYLKRESIVVFVVKCQMWVAFVLPEKSNSGIWHSFCRVCFIFLQQSVTLSRIMVCRLALKI